VLLNLGHLNLLRSIDLAQTLTMLLKLAESIIGYP